MNIKAFVPTTKPEMAKLFYGGILGLKLLSEDEYALEFEANGILLRVNIVDDLRPQVFTILGWNVPDIAFLVDTLSKKGVVFEKYNFLEQDSLGIWMSPTGAKVAWFKDPDENVLSLTQI